MRATQGYWFLEGFAARLAERSEGSAERSEGSAERQEFGADGSRRDAVLG